LIPDENSNHRIEEERFGLPLWHYEK